jgi:hypothetical protein
MMIIEINLPAELKIGSGHGIDCYTHFRLDPTHGGAGGEGPVEVD